MLLRIIDTTTTTTGTWDTPGPVRGGACPGSRPSARSGPVVPRNLLVLPQVSPGVGLCAPFLYLQQPYPYFADDKVRHREGKKLAQGRSAGKCQRSELLTGLGSRRSVPGARMGR